MGWYCQVTLCFFYLSTNNTIPCSLSWMSQAVSLSKKGKSLLIQNSTPNTPYPFPVTTLSPLPRTASLASFFAFWSHVNRGELLHLYIFHSSHSREKEDTHFILLISVLTSLLCPPQNFDDYQYCITNKTLAEIWIRLRIFFPYPITCSLC